MVSWFFHTLKIHTQYLIHDPSELCAEIVGGCSLRPRWAREKGVCVCARVCDLFMTRMTCSWDWYSRASIQTAVRNHTPRRRLRQALSILIAAHTHPPRNVSDEYSILYSEQVSQMLLLLERGVSAQTRPQAMQTCTVCRCSLDALLRATSRCSRLVLLCVFKGSSGSPRKETTLEKEVYRQRRRDGARSTGRTLRDAQTPVLELQMVP